MDPVTVPANVAEAFDFYKKAWGRMKFEEDKALLMLLPATVAANPSADVLKQFALKCPTRYMEAILYGYKPHIDLKKEIAKSINEWLDAEYVGDPNEEVEAFAARLIHRIQQKS